MKKKYVIYIFLLMFLAGLFFFVNLKSGENIKKIKDSNTNNVQFSAIEKTKESPTTVAEKVVSEMANTQLKVHPLSNRLSTSDDYRALSLKFQSEPKSGGAYYAALINFRCFELTKMLSEVRLSAANTPHRIASKRDQVIESMKAKCRNFTVNELSIDQLREIYKQRDRDPVLKAMTNARNKNKTGPEICEDLSNLFKTQSPEAISDATLYNGASGIFFDKKNYGPIATDALALAMCDLGADCSQNNFFVQRNCVIHSVCTDSAWESMRQILAKTSKNSSVDFDKLQSLSKQMATAIQRNEVQKFSPTQCK